MHSSLLELIEGPSYMVHTQISTQAVAILSLIYVNRHITFIESFIIYGDKEQGMLFYIGRGGGGGGRLFVQPLYVLELNFHPIGW